MQINDLLISLFVALAAALVGGLVAARLRQSTMLGYIVAGIVIGPFTPGPAGDIDAVRQLADIGIVFLMFAVGVQLSLRDLLRAGPLLLAGGSVQVIVMIGLGYMAGIAVGFGPVEALFLGAVVSNSSSTVLGKVLQERGDMDSEPGRLGLGWSTVQDLSTIALVVILSAVARQSDSWGLDLLVALGQAAVFLVIIGPVGSRVLPWVFERIAELRSREVFIVAVITIALGTAYVAFLFGLSLALGAFIAGVIVSESDLSHRILGEVVPVRDIFAALFFVFIGMLIDPMFVVQNLHLVALVVVLILLVKGAVVVAIALVARRAVRTALVLGVLLAQSGEFSFLLARLGDDLGAISPRGFSALLAGAAVSIIVAPGLYHLAVPIARAAERRLSRGEADTGLEDGPVGIRRHAVICGFGRVGRVLGDALRRRGLPFLVIESDARIVRRLREQGVTAFLGNADNPVLLDLANLDQARVLVVAIPDPVAARLIVDYAKRVNPRLDIVVRTHSVAEKRYLEEREVGEAVIGELELALELTRHTLRRFGVSAMETFTIIEGLRQRAYRDEPVD